MLSGIKQALITTISDPWSAINLARLYFTSPAQLDALASIRHAADTPLEVYNKAVSMLKTGAEPLFKEPEITGMMARANFIRMKPILAAAFQGDRQMQMRYDRERLASLSSLPAWLDKKCTAIAYEKIEGIRMGGYTERAYRGILRLQVEEGGIDPLEGLFIRTFLTTHDMRIFLTEAQHHSFRGRIGGNREMSFSAVARDPMGNQAREALRICVGYIHTTRITLDMCAILGVQLKPDAILSITRAHLRDPWGIVASETFSRMLEVSRILNARAVPPTAQERDSLLQRCQYSSPRFFLPELKPVPVHTGTPPEAAQPKTAPEEVPSTSFDDPRDVLRNTVIDALSARLPRSHSTSNRELARLLYKAVKRGELDLDDTLTALSRGLSAQELLEAAAEKSKALEEQKKKPAHPPGPTSLASPIDSAVAEPSVSVGNKVVLKASFSEWFTSLTSQSTTAQIQRRIERLEHGNLGKFNTVRGGILELKQGSLRIYLRKVANHEYHVIMGGTKATQDQDIEKCQTL